ncbi:MAG: hypothetical protein P5680_25185, partial [Limnospira sp. PMC 737.11]|uniref:hypothetical protein n=1 Tax=Limnospira sp. PMC 737.11 TaxID=2981095 RepID=UPI0028E1136C
SDRETQHSRLGWEWLSFGRVSWVHITYSWCDRFTQQTRTLVGWVERSRNPTQSARLGVVKFWWGFLGSPNLLLML